MNQNTGENKMGIVPVNKLLISMSLPMMISMLVQALYNIVDSIFVSRIAETAVRAVSLSFPLQSLMIAIASGSAVGVNALLSRSLGEKNYEKVNKVAGNGIFMAILCYLLFVLIGLFAVRPFMYSQTGVESVRNYGVSYLTLCCVCSVGMFTQMIFERLLQSTGKTFYTMKYANAFAGFCIVTGSVFQALGNGVYSMIVSIARQLVVLLPVAYLLSLTGNVVNIWWAFPIAEIMSVAMTVFFLLRINKKVISHIGEQALS